MTRPRLLSETQFKGLLKVGDILIPGDAELPSFSASGCAVQIDRMLPYMTESDRNGFKLLMALFRFLPRPIIRALVALTEQQRRFPDPIGSLLRMMNIGVKGAVMTLYYSDVGTGRSIHEIIGWDAKIVEREPEE